MITSISSEALLNYKKDIWKIKIEKKEEPKNHKSTKNHDTFQDIQTYMWSREWFEGKYNIGFGILIKFSSQRKKNIEIGPEIMKLWLY